MVSAPEEDELANSLAMAAQLATSAVKVGWYVGINRLMERQASRLMKQHADADGDSGEVDFSPRGPVPTRDELLAELRRLIIRDAVAVRDGLWPAEEGRPERLPGHIRRLAMMFRDLPELVERRGTRKADTVLDFVTRDDLPDYYTQDFHFQSGGHLSDESARLYDVQVDTLFYGSADAMRRAALRPIAERLKGHDQRGISMLDVACGTGRFLVDVRRAFPAMKLAGLDLSPSYLAEAAENLKGFKAVNWLEAPAEEMPLASASQDIVTCIYLFHELPPDVRRKVAREIARVLKPGGLFVLIDSLQTGDKPDWDGLLELFPVRFHEPYYRHYLRDDLSAVFSEAGFDAGQVELVFLSKLMAFQRSDSATEQWNEEPG